MLELYHMSNKIAPMTPTKNLSVHGRRARVTKHDEVPHELAESIASIPLTEEQKEIVNPKHPRIVAFERKLAMANLLQDIHRERSK